MTELECWLAQQHVNDGSAPLPLTHVTSWSNFERIVRMGSLVAQPCPVFGQRLLYLSYGSVAYRPSRKARSWCDDEAVLLMFPYASIHRAVRFFPFDTGAVATGRFRTSHMFARHDFRSDCGIQIAAATTPARWVDAVFGSHECYLSRFEALPLRSGEVPLRDWREMQQHFRTGNQTDHRLVNVECHLTGDVPLDEVLWMGVPLHKRDEAVHAFATAGRLMPPTLFYEDVASEGALPNDLRLVAEAFFCEPRDAAFATRMVAATPG